jgi:lysozyme
MNTRAQIAGFEGKRNVAYPDPLTGGDPWTIGYGHTGPEVFRGLVWSDKMCESALDADIESASAECALNFPFFGALNEPRKAVLIGMCFQMGIGRLLKFRDTLAAIRDERFEHAGECMRQSRWARQTKTRAQRLSFQMALGEWQ